MPYGPDKDNPTKVSAGSLELLGQGEIVRRANQLDIPDKAIASLAIQASYESVELEPAVDDVKGIHIVIMNPPFTNRSKMGEKFPKGTQEALRARVDTLEKVLISADPEMQGFLGQEHDWSFVRSSGGPLP